MEFESTSLRIVRRLMIGAFIFSTACTGAAAPADCSFGQACDPLTLLINYNFVTVPVTPNDFNGDGYSDVVVGAAQSGGPSTGYADFIFGNADFFTSRQTARITGTDTVNGQFGLVGGIGDVNNDGIDDVAFGEIGAGQGRGFVFLGRHVWPENQTSDAATCIIESENITATDYLASHIARLGDLNGDNIDDFAVAATNLLNTGGANILYVFFGGSTLNCDTTQPSLEIAGGGGTGLGVAAFDWNGDGRRDLIVGAPRATGAAADSGQVYVYFGDDQLYGGGSFGISDADLVISGVAPDRIGRGIADLGDINLDGYDDVLIGAPAGSTTTDDGRAYLLFCGPTMTGFPENTLISELPGVVTFTGENILTTGADYFGQSVELLPDYNGDGYRDFIITASKSDGNPASERAYMYSYSPSLSGTVTFSSAYAIITSTDKFGWMVASPGDLNNDGIADFAVSHFNYPTGPRNGVLRFFRGQSYTGSFADTENAFSFEGAGTNDFYGVSVTRGYEDVEPYLQSPYFSGLQIHP